MQESNRKLKVGLVLDASLDNTDGVQQYVLDLGSWLSKQGHDVHYLVGESKRSDIKNLHSLSRNIKVKFNGNRTTMPLPVKNKKIEQLLNNQKFDVLHVQVPYSPFLAHKLIKLAPKDTVIIGTFHIVAYSSLVNVANRLLGFWLRKSLKKFNLMLSTSSASLKYAKKYYGINSEVMPCAIDHQLFNKAERLSKYTNDKINILFLGRLVPRKGCITLLKAMLVIKKESDINKYRILICGDGPLKEKIISFINSSSLESNVEMVGFVDEDLKANYYASADISVFPSSGGESFGIVLLEAMASGRSVVLAGDNPGYKTVLESRPELLFDTVNYKELAKKIMYFSENKMESNKLREWEKNFTSKFDVSVVGTKIENIYYRLIFH